MIRHALPFAVLAAVASPAAAEVEVTSNGPVVELSITENVNVDPDIVNLSAGVTTVAPTAVEAMRQNAQQMNSVIARIEALGVDEDDIQTAGVNLSAEYDYDQQRQQQVFRGYRVMNRVVVKLRDIDRTGQVLDALVEAGATDLGGIGWGVEDPEPAQEQARAAAFATGRERALAYARAAGYSDVRLLEISEAISGRPPMPYEAIQVASEARSDMATPVRPGQVQAGVTVNFTWEMTQ